MGQSSMVQNFNPAAVPWYRWAGLVLWLVAILGLSLNYVQNQYGGASGWNGTLNVFFFIFAVLGAAAVGVAVFLKVSLPFPIEFVVGGLFALTALFGILEFLVTIGDLGDGGSSASDQCSGLSGSTYQACVDAANNASDKYSIVYGAGAYICLAVAFVVAVVAAFEIMEALKAPKHQPSAGGQWGQPAVGQWGQPAPGQPMPGHQFPGQPAPGMQPPGQPGPGAPGGYPPPQQGWGPPQG